VKIQQQLQNVVIAEQSGALDAEDVCGLTGKFDGGASDLDRSRRLRRRESRR